MTAPNRKKVEKRRKQRARKRGGPLDSLQVAKAIKESGAKDEVQKPEAVANQSEAIDQPPLKASKSIEGGTAHSMSQAEPNEMQTCEDGPEHPVWPDDGSLSAKNNEHIAAGLWAVDTINPNVWAGVRKYFDKTAADIVIAL